MNISEVADRSGLPPKTIRYYEDIGLIRPKRSDNGYRVFTDHDVHRLAFVARARTLGFPIEDCRTLLELYEDDNRTSAQVRALAQDHLEQIDDKIAKLQSLHTALSRLIAACHGDNRPDCPILDDLAELPMAGE